MNELVGTGIGFQRIRRITGYLVGTIERFNDAKRSEEHDRVKHGLATTVEERAKPGKDAARAA